MRTHSGISVISGCFPTVFGSWRSISSDRAGPAHTFCKSFLSKHLRSRGRLTTSHKSLVRRILRNVQRWPCRQGGKIVQIPESREEYRDYAYYYKVVFPFDGLPRGIFVEIIAVQCDLDDPIVHIVNAHPQGV